jgi:hypothetical protein
MSPPPSAWLVAMGVLAASPAHGQSGITLAITSPDGETAFTGACTIAGPEGERTESYDQPTPLELAFEGAHGLRCRLESAGTLEVTAQGPGGTVSRTRTSGGTVTINLGG